MPINIDLEEKNAIARSLGYDGYDNAILTMYYDLQWALPPIANRFGVSAMTISNRITKVHGRKLRPKGGKRKTGLPVVVEKQIPVKSRRNYEECENYKTQRGYSGGNSIWHAGARV